VRRTRRLAIAIGTLAWMSPVASVDAQTHVVERGDTLWEVARAHGCSVAKLQSANDLEPDEPVRPGQRLTIPRCAGRPDTGGEATTYQVRAGDTLSQIAQRFGTTVQDVKARNDLRDSTIVVGQHLVVAGKPAVEVRVVQGQSVGGPGRGKLVGGVQLPQDRAYYRRRPKWSWGAQHVVDHTRRAVAQVRRKHPDLHRLAIGDISQPRGGSIPGHRSHQSGRDVDLGLYFRREPSGYPKEFVKASNGELHVEAMWTLIEALWKASRQPGGPEKIFLDYRVQGALYEHARKQGVSKAALEEIFQYPDGRWSHHRLVMHEPMHADHLHVRFACPPKDDRCR
jgi:LysM repeat protein